MNHHLENYYSGDSAWNQFVSLYSELLGAIEHYFEYDDFQD